MAWILFNPMHRSHISIHLVFMNMLQFIWRCTCNYFFGQMNAIYRFLLYQIFIYLPHWLIYRTIRLRLSLRWRRLSWVWWWTVFRGHWYEPQRKPGKINGTYWMHNREDLYALSSQFKELQRFRRRLDNRAIYNNTYVDNVAGFCIFAA